MKFSQVLEYKTQTQISYHQIEAQTNHYQIQPTNPSINPTKSHPQQPPKIQIKKIKTPKPIRSEREWIRGERAHLIWVALLGLRGLGLRRGDFDLSKMMSDPVTFSDGVVFGRKIWAMFSPSFSRFLFFWFFLDSCFFISLSGLINRVLNTRFPSGHHMKKIPHQSWSNHGNRVSKTQFIGPKSSLLNSKCQ